MNSYTTYIYSQTSIAKAIQPAQAVKAPYNKMQLSLEFHFFLCNFIKIFYFKDVNKVNEK